MLKLKPDQIKANIWNCNFLGPTERANLKQRMNEDGPEKTLPIVVRKITDHYEIVDGEHRWIIAKELKWETINALEREADDLLSKSLCISYNRWRGRLNWFKLYDVLKKDQDNGINLPEAYQEALSNKELEWILSLGKLVPQARDLMEDALRKYPEITLEQLYLLALFPASQQCILIEKFKTPVIAQALTEALTPFLQKQQTKFTTEKDPQTITITPNQTIANAATQRADYLKEQQTQHAQSTIFPQNWKRQSESELNTSTPSLQITNQESDANIIDQQASIIEKEVHKSLLFAVNYDCDCGRHYHANFRNFTIIVQKQNGIFEHVNLKPRTFQVHCNKCNSDHEFTIEDTEQERLQIFCTRCKPQREGTLDINTGEATWIDHPYQ